MWGWDCLHVKGTEKTGGRATVWIPSSTGESAGGKGSTRESHVKEEKGTEIYLKPAVCCHVRILSFGFWSVGLTLKSFNLDHC